MHNKDVSNFTLVPFLDDRDAMRSASLRISGFGAEIYTTTCDTKYEARDRVVSSERGCRTFLAAAMILRDCVALHAPILDLKATLMSIGFSNTVVNGVKKDFEIASLQFDSKWLQTLKSITTEEWCSIHHHLSVSSNILNKYDIMIWLSTMAFAASTNMDIIQALSMIYKMDSMTTASIPSFSKVELISGDKWSESQLISCIGIATRNITLCPEGQLKKEYRESKAEHAQRANAQFKKSQEAAIHNFVRDLKVQGFKRHPSTPSSTVINTYLDTSVAMTHVKGRYKEWRQNGTFIKYLSDLSTLMRNQVSIAIAPRPLMFVRPVAQNELSDSTRYIGIATMFTALAPATFPGNGLFVPEKGIVNLTTSCDIKR
jgi:hypothetical protein